MFRYISAAFSAAILVMPLYGGNYEVKSPDGRLKAEVSVGERIGYTVSCGDDIILRSSEIGMILRDRSLGQDAVLKSTERESVDRTEECLFPISDANIRNCYNSLTLNMKGGYSVEFRAFNDGIAYRFITDLKGDIEVLDERFSLEFPGNTDAVLSLNRGFKTSYEQPYTVIPVGDIRQDGQVSYLPVLFRTESAGSGNGYSILMSEADLYDYPCMFLRSDGKENTEGSLLYSIHLRGKDIPVEVHGDFRRRQGHSLKPHDGQPVLPVRNRGLQLDQAGPGQLGMVERGLSIRT